MDAASRRAKYAQAYRQAAAKSGVPCALYRPTGPGNPIDPGNLITTLPVLIGTDATFSKPPMPGKPQRLAYLDATVAQPGDYLVGTDGTYFLAAILLPAPPLAIECNDVITVTRYALPTAVGALDYNGVGNAADTVLLASWPASILQGRVGTKNDLDLPSDVTNPNFQLMMAAPPVALRTSDVVTDQAGMRWLVVMVETNLTPTARYLRMTLQQAMT